MEAHRRSMHNSIDMHCTKFQIRYTCPWYILSDWERPTDMHLRSSSFVKHVSLSHLYTPLLPAIVISSNLEQLRFNLMVQDDQLSTIGTNARPWSRDQYLGLVPYISADNRKRCCECSLTQHKSTPNSEKYNSVHLSVAGDCKNDWNFAACRCHKFLPSISTWLRGRLDDIMLTCI